MTKRIALVKAIDSYRGRKRRILQVQCAAIIRGSEFNDFRSACIVNVSGCKIRAHQDAVGDDSFLRVQLLAIQRAEPGKCSAVSPRQEEKLYYNSLALGIK